MEKEFWKVYNSIPNFLKHAETDADEVLEFEEEWVDLTLMFSAAIYRDLGFALTPEMFAIITIVGVQNPKLLTLPPEHKAWLDPIVHGFAGTSRQEFLRLGSDLIRAKIDRQKP